MILNYRKTGQGHPLIILHGLYGSGENWLTIAKGLSSVCEIILVDQRNHGHSFHSGIHDYQAMSNDLLNLMDHLQIPSANILGHSMGGRTAMRFSAEFPGRVTGLIVADISPRSYTDPLLDAGHQEFHGNILQTLSELNIQEIHSYGQADEMMAPGIPDKRIRQFLLKNLERNSDGGFRWLLNIPALIVNLDKINQGIEEFLEEGNPVTRFPVMFIRGDQSDYIQQEDIQMIRKIYPLAQMVTIKNAGHWLHAEQPAFFISVVKRFLLNR